MSVAELRPEQNRSNLFHTVVGIMSAAAGLPNRSCSIYNNFPMALAAAI